MEIKKVKWCLGIKDGLKIIEPNDRLAKSYLEQSKSSLIGAQKDLEYKDLIWATVKIYYAEYFAIYSFLQKIGVKCENHSCSISTAMFLLGKEKIKIINEHKEKRIDAQYYLKVGQNEKIKEALKEAKKLIANLDETISNTFEKEIKEYRLKLKELNNK